MKRLHSYTYKIRSLLILVPLMLLAVSTWGLSKAITPDLPDDLRAELLLSVRICCPGLFAVAVAFFVPTFDRFFQIAMVSINYIALVFFIPMYMPSISENPIICVVSAITSLFAFLPNIPHVEGFIPHTRRILLGLMFSIILPLITVISITLILRQMNIYVLFTFDEIFGRSVLSGIYVPVYLTLQALGFQAIVSDLVTVSYQNNMVTSFVNTVIVTNMLSLPAALFARSLFARYHTRLFMTLLVVITLLTSSIGACVSLTWLIIFVFYPGTFGILMVSSVVCFSISYIMRVAPITSVSNLYLPDVNLAYTSLFYSSQITFLEMFAICLPIALVTLCMTIKRDQSKRRRNKVRFINFGYSVRASSTPELKLIALLRALGGISNISDVEEDGTWLYIQVLDRDETSHSTLNMLMQKKVLVDRINKLYLCNVGSNSHFYYTRLIKLLENQFEEEEYKIPLSAPFTIDDFRRVELQQPRNKHKKMPEQKFMGMHRPFHSHWGPHGPHIYQNHSTPLGHKTKYTQLIRPKKQASAFQTATAAPMSLFSPRAIYSSSPTHGHDFSPNAYSSPQQPNTDHVVLRKVASNVAQVGSMTHSKVLDETLGDVNTLHHLHHARDEYDPMDYTARAMLTVVERPKHKDEDTSEDSEDYTGNSKFAWTYNAINWGSCYIDDLEKECAEMEEACQEPHLRSISSDDPIEAALAKTIEKLAREDLEIQAVEQIKARPTTNEFLE